VRQRESLAAAEQIELEKWVMATPEYACVLEYYNWEYFPRPIPVAVIRSS
jgi:hypothetical protein